MYIAIVVVVKVHYGVYDLVGFLGGGCVVKVNEWVAVDLAVKDREVATNGLDV